MSKIFIGDIFASKAQTLVNTVNCVGVMGKGIALQFKNKYPAMFDDYKLRCAKGLVKPGVPYLYTDLLGTSILNFPTKDDWRSQSNIGYVISGLRWFADNYERLGIRSIAFPPLGCGNGGLLWEDVGPIMYKYLDKLPIDVEIYAPFGTKREYLTEEYLSKEPDVQRYVGAKMSKIKEETACILEIIHRLNNDPYAHYIGRVMYQKLCYFATREGLDTGFTFEHFFYGPFSPEAKEAFIAFSNMNLIIEARKGKMDAVLLTPNYLPFRQKHIETIKAKESIIEKVVDLFSRIRSTRQAEVYATVLFAYENVKTKSRDSIVDYIIHWKKTWSSEQGLIEINQGINDLRDINYLSVR